MRQPPTVYKSQVPLALNCAIRKLKPAQPPHLSSRLEGLETFNRRQRGRVANSWNNSRERDSRNNELRQ